MVSNVSIIGAGLNGLMCAITLARRGFNVEVFERRTHQDICAPKYSLNGKIGRSMSMDLSTRGLFALKEINVFDEIVARSIPMIDKIYHLQNGSVLPIPYGRDKSEHILAISRTDLYKILFNTCRDYPNISIRFGHILHDVDVNLHLLNFLVPSERRESLISTDILIGADGVNSKVREILERENKLPFKKSLYDHCYKELTIPKNKLSGLHHNAMHLWPRHQFMLVAQPNFDGSFTCALILKNDTSKESFKHIEGAQAVVEFFQTHFPDVVNLMPHLASEYKENPVGYLNTISGTRWVHNDFILILGDAAHGMVPFFGQGVNCGFEDCTILSELLDQTAHHWPNTMKMFNAIRVPDANAISSMSSINYPELLEEPDLEKIILEKQLENMLSKEFSHIYRTYHNMVCFDRIPYSCIEKIRTVQTKLLAQFAEQNSNIDNIDRSQIENLINIYKDQIKTVDTTFYSTQS